MSQMVYHRGIAQSVLRLATGWAVRGSNPCEGEVFCTRPDRSWGLPSLLYKGYRVSFPGLKRPGRGVEHTSSSSSDVKERVGLCLPRAWTLMACYRVNFTLAVRWVHFRVFVFCPHVHSTSPCTVVHQYGSSSIRYLV